MPCEPPVMRMVRPWAENLGEAKRDMPSSAKTRGTKMRRNSACGESSRSESPKERRPLVMTLRGGPPYIEGRGSERRSGRC